MTTAGRVKSGSLQPPPHPPTHVAPHAITRPLDHNTATVDRRTNMQDRQGAARVPLARPAAATFYARSGACRSAIRRSRRVHSLALEAGKGMGEWANGRMREWVRGRRVVGRSPGRSLLLQLNSGAGSLRGRRHETRRVVRRDLCYMNTKVEAAGGPVRELGTVRGAKPSLCRGNSRKL